MKKPPYSLDEARKIAADFQYLIGQRFDADFFATVDCVVVSPFDEMSKNRFFIYYLLFENAETALNYEYKGLLFDVVVIAGSAEKKELLQESLFDWVGKNKSVGSEAADVSLSVKDEPHNSGALINVMLQ